MRLKKWTKDLDLTAEQQKQVKALFDAEAKEISKLESGPNLSVAARSDQVGKIHAATYAKMKPLLTETQVVTFEKILSKTNKPKK